jgi:hypothetical protein
MRTQKTLYETTVMVLNEKNIDLLDVLKDMATYEINMIDQLRRIERTYSPVMQLIPLFRGLYSVIKFALGEPKGSVHQSRPLEGQRVRKKLTIKDIENDVDELDRLINTNPKYDKKYNPRLIKHLKTFVDSFNLEMELYRDQNDVKHFNK